jgi:hypothetical protein
MTRFVSSASRLVISFFKASRFEAIENHEKQACSHSSFFFWGVEFFLGAGLKFPPNACRGERCGGWGRIAPINPVCFRSH